MVGLMVTASHNPEEVRSISSRSDLNYVMFAFGSTHDLLSLLGENDRTMD